MEQCHGDERPQGGWLELHYQRFAEQGYSNNGRFLTSHTLSGQSAFLPIPAIPEIRSQSGERRPSKGLAGDLLPESHAIGKLARQMD
jgi:hypothetical protein